MKTFNFIFRAVFTLSLVLVAAAAGWAQNAGNVDAAFDPGVGPSNPIYSVAVQGDGKIVIGGNFLYLGTYTVNGFARLNADGSIDFSFNPVNGANGRVLAVALQADGKVLIGGEFTAVNGYPRSGLARLNTDGSVDATFGNDDGANNVVRGIAVQPDGQILVGGDFTEFNDYSYSRLVRLNGTDGSLDFSFYPGSGASAPVGPIVLQADGSILVGGDFLYFDGYYTGGLVRLDAAGNIDTTLGGSNPPFPDNYVTALLVQPDGKIVVGGAFSEIGGYNLSAVARLNTDGTVDTTFYDPAGGPNGTVLALGIQPDGSIVIGGDFTAVDYIDGGSIARLTPGGILDTTYGPGYPANGAVNSLQLLPSGETVAAGAFTSIGGITRDFIAQLFQTPTANPTNATYIRLLSLNGMSFGANSTLALTADANSPGDPVTSVTLYDNDAVVAQSSLSEAEIAALPSRAKTIKDAPKRQDAPFGQSFPNLGALLINGLNNVKVVGKTQSGATVTSNTAAIMGQAPGNAAAPTCQIASPTSGAMPAAGTAVQVNVAKSAQAVTVQFYVDSAKSGSNQVQPGNQSTSTFTLPSLSADHPHYLTAVVTDNSLNLSSQSAQVVLTPTVTTPTPTPTPTPASPPVVTITTAGDGDAVEGGEAGKAAVHRTGDTTTALTVYYKVTGAAQAGVDYKALGGTVTIPAGAAQVKVKIKPIDNTVVDGTRVAKIKLKPAPDGSYTLGTATTAKIKIIDND